MLGVLSNNQELLSIFPFKNGRLPMFSSSCCQLLLWLPNDVTLFERVSKLNDSYLAAQHRRGLGLIIVPL
jgi:hypothetical protein